MRKARRSLSALFCLLVVLMQTVLVNAVLAQTQIAQPAQNQNQGNNGSQVAGAANNTQNTVPNPYQDAPGVIPVFSNSSDVNVQGGSYNGGSTRGIDLNVNDILKRDNPYGQAEQSPLQPRVFLPQAGVQNAQPGQLNQQMQQLQQQNQGLSSLAIQAAEQGNGAPQGGVNNILNSSLGNINDTYRGMHQFFNDDIIGNLFSQIGQLIGKWISEIVNGWIADTVQFLASFLRVFVLNPNIAVNGLNGSANDGISPYIRQGADVMYGIAVDLLLLLFILAIWKYWAEAAWRGGSNLMGAVGRLIFTSGLLLAFPTLYAFEIQITNEMIKAIYFNSSDQVMMLDAALASAIKGGILAGVGGLASAFAPLLGGIAMGVVGGTVGELFAFAGLVIFMILGGILIAELIYILVLKAIQTALLTAQYMFAPIFLVFFATPDTENIASGFIKAWVETSLWTFVWVGLLKIMVIIMFSDYNPWGKILMAVGVLQMMIQVPTFLSRAQISPMSDFVSAGLVFGGMMKMFGALQRGAQTVAGRVANAAYANTMNKDQQTSGTQVGVKNASGDPAKTNDLSMNSRVGRGEQKPPPPAGKGINGLNPDGTPKPGFGKDGKPLPGHDVNGKKINGLDQNGKPLPGFDKDGKPLAGHDQNGKQILGLDKDGKPLPGYNADGTPMGGFDKDGKPLDANGKPLPVDSTGKPVGAAGGANVPPPQRAAAGGAGAGGANGTGANGGSVNGGKPYLGPDGKTLMQDGQPIRDSKGMPVQAKLGADGKSVLNRAGTPLKAALATAGVAAALAAAQSGKGFGLDEGGKPLPGFDQDGKPLKVDGKGDAAVNAPDAKLDGKAKTGEQDITIGEDGTVLKGGKPMLDDKGNEIKAKLTPDGKGVVRTDGSPLPGGAPAAGIAAALAAKKAAGDKAGGAAAGGRAGAGAGGGTVKAPGAAPSVDANGAPLDAKGDKTHVDTSTTGTVNGAPMKVNGQEVTIGEDGKTLMVGGKAVTENGKAVEVKSSADGKTATKADGTALPAGLAVAAAAALAARAGKPPAAGSGQAGGGAGSGTVKGAGAAGGTEQGAALDAKGERTHVETSATGTVLGGPVKFNGQEVTIGEDGKTLMVGGKPATENGKALEVKSSADGKTATKADGTALPAGLAVAAAAALAAKAGRPPAAGAGQQAGGAGSGTVKGAGAAGGVEQGAALDAKGERTHVETSATGTVLGGPVKFNGQEVTIGEDGKTLMVGGKAATENGKPIEVKSSADGKSATKADGAALPSGLAVAAAAALAARAGRPPTAVAGQTGGVGGGTVKGAAGAGGVEQGAPIDAKGDRTHVETSATGTVLGGPVKFNGQEVTIGDDGKTLMVGGKAATENGKAVEVKSSADGKTATRADGSALPSGLAGAAAAALAARRGGVAGGVAGGNGTASGGTVKGGETVQTPAEVLRQQQLATQRTETPVKTETATSIHTEGETRSAGEAQQTGSGTVTQKGGPGVTTPAGKPTPVVATPGSAAKSPVTPTVATAVAGGAGGAGGSGGGGSAGGPAGPAGPGGPGGGAGGGAPPPAAAPIDADEKTWKESPLSSKYFNNSNLFAVDAVRGIVGKIKTLSTRVREGQPANFVEGSTRGGANMISMREGATDAEKAHVMMTAGFADKMGDDSAAADAAKRSAVSAGATRPQGALEGALANYMSYQGQDFGTSAIAKNRMQRAVYAQAVKGSADYINGKQGNDYTEYLRGRYGAWNDQMDATAVWLATDGSSSESAWNPAIGPATDALSASGLAITAATRGAIQNPYVMTMRPGARKSAVGAVLRACMYDPRMEGVDPGSETGAVRLGEIARSMPESFVTSAISVNAVSGGKDLAPDNLQTVAQLSSELGMPADTTYRAMSLGAGAVAAGITGKSSFGRAKNFDEVRRMCYAESGGDSAAAAETYATIINSSADRVRMMNTAGVNARMMIDPSFSSQVNDFIADPAVCGGFVNIDDPNNSAQRDNLQTAVVAAGTTVRQMGTAGFTGGRAKAVFQWIQNGNNPNQMSGQDIVVAERLVTSGAPRLTPAVVQSARILDPHGSGPMDAEVVQRIDSVASYVESSGSRSVQDVVIADRLLQSGATSLSASTVQVARTLVSGGSGPIAPNLMADINDVAGYVDTRNARPEQAQIVRSMIREGGGQIPINAQTIEVATRVSQELGGFNASVTRIEANLVQQGIVRSAGDAHAVFSNCVRADAESRGIDPNGPLNEVLNAVQNDGGKMEVMEQAVMDIQKSGGFESRQMINPVVFQAAYNAMYDPDPDANRNRVQSIQVAERIHGAGAVSSPEILEVYDEVLDNGVSGQQMNMQSFYAAKALQQANGQFGGGGGGGRVVPTYQAIQRILRDPRFSTNQASPNRVPQLPRDLFEEIQKMQTPRTP